MPAMVTDQEIQREMDTLRSLRRRSASSTGPGALALDPDLPSMPPNHATSPTSAYSQSPWSTSPPNSNNHLTRTSRQYSFSHDVHDSGYGESVPQLSPGTYSLGGNPSSTDESVLGTPNTVDSHGGDGHQALAGTIPPAPGDDPTHLFWVPAHLHPEIAPGQFRAFLKQHTSDDPTAEGEAIDGGLVRAPSSGSAPGLARTPSWLSRAPSMQAAREEGLGGAGGSGLGRKRSMLSKQYHPRAGDKVEEEAPPSIDLARRGSTNRSSIYGGLYGEKGLTLQDLQKLEVMADQAAESDDPGKMRDLLRSSYSMNIPPDVLEQTAAYGIESRGLDGPLLLPPPNQIIRRNARTKIRKPGELGLGSTRGRGRLTSGSQPLGEVINDEEPSDNRHFTGRTDMSRVTLHDGPPSPRRRASDHSDGSEDMYSAEDGYTPEEMARRVPHGLVDERGHRKFPSASSATAPDVYGAYDRTEDTIEGDTSVESMTSSASQGPTEESSNPQSPSPPDEEDKYMIEVQHEEDVWKQKTPTSATSQDPARQFIVSGRRDHDRHSPPSSPETVRERQQDQRNLPSPNTAYNQLLPQTAAGSATDGRGTPIAPRDRMEALRAEVAEPPHRTLEKQQSQERLRKEKEKEKKGGFFSKKKEDSKVKKGDKGSKEKEGLFGSLFGNKKKQEEPAPLKFSSAGPAAAAALLGQSKSAKSIGLIPMNGASPTSPGFAPYARYPIHVERAVYRLSHIKLANPRRPLYEQVLISNLMFWYLSIINRSANPSPAVAEEKDKAATPTTPPTPDRKMSSSPPLASSPAPNATGQGQQDARKSGSLRSIPAHTPPGKSGSLPSASVPSASQDQQAKRIGLTKAPEQRPGPQAGRRAEIPVRPPQYGMQNLQIDQESNRYGQAPSRQAPPPQMQSRTNSEQSNAQFNGPSAGRSTPPMNVPQPHLQAPPPPSRRQPSPVPPPIRPQQPPSPPNMQYPNQQEYQQQQAGGGRAREVSPSIPRPQVPPPDAYNGAPTPRAIAPSRSMHNLGQEEMRRVATDRPTIQTQGLSGPYPGSEHMERRSTDVPSALRSTRAAGSIQHGGVQPGQVFQYPGGHSAAVQPGHVFNHMSIPGALPVGQSPGQVFQHPQYTPYPHQSPSAQLPPGALPPRVSQVAQNSWGGPASGPGTGSAPRRSNSGGEGAVGGSYGADPYDKQYLGPGSPQQRSFSGSNGPPFGQPYPDPQGGSRSVSAHGPGGGRSASPSQQQYAYPHAPPPSQQPQPHGSGAPYNPYLRQQGAPSGPGSVTGGRAQPGGPNAPRRSGSDEGHGGQYARRAPVGQQAGLVYERR